MKTQSAMDINVTSEPNGDTVTEQNESLPLTDIIKKFQKVKEGRFKPKDKKKLNLSPLQTYDADESGAHFDKTTLKTLFEVKTPEPGLYLYAHDDVVVKGPEQSTSTRRMSLPSLFHPFLPILPFKSDSKESITEDRHIDKDMEIDAMRKGRRHSMSHVIKEYAKQDVNQLSKLEKLKILNAAMEARNNGDEVELDDDDKIMLRGYLTGEELHAFYTLWDRPDKTKIDEKLRAHRKLHPLTQNGDNKDTVRPRVFSL